MNKKTFQQKYWDKTNEQEDSMVLEFLNSLDKTKTYKYLEVGAGLGRFLSIIKNEYQNLDIQCLEINPDLVEKLNQKGFKTTQGSILEIPFENETFDIVQASHIIEHFGYPDITKVLDELFRVLKKGGYLIIRTPLMHPGFYNDIDHIRPYPLKTLRQYFANEQQQSTPKFKAELVKYWNRHELYQTNIKITGVWILNHLFKILWTKFDWPKAKANGYVAIFKKI